MYDEYLSPLRANHLPDLQIYQPIMLLHYNECTVDLPLRTNFPRTFGLKYHLSYNNTYLYTYFYTALMELRIHLEDSCFTPNYFVL